MENKVPENLYQHRLYLKSGIAVTVLTDIVSDEGFWKKLQDLKKVDDSIVLWTRENNGSFKKFFFNVFNK